MQPSTKKIVLSTVAHSFAYNSMFPDVRLIPYGTNTEFAEVPNWIVGGLTGYLASMVGTGVSKLSLGKVAEEDLANWQSLLADSVSAGITAPLIIQAMNKDVYVLPEVMSPMKVGLLSAGIEAASLVAIAML